LAIFPSFFPFPPFRTWASISHLEGEASTGHRTHRIFIVHRCFRLVYTWCNNECIIVSYYTWWKTRKLFSSYMISGIAIVFLHWCMLICHCARLLFKRLFSFLSVILQWVLWCILVYLISSLSLKMITVRCIYILSINSPFNYD